MLFGCVENGVGERTCCGVDVGVEECVPVDVVEGLVKFLPLCVAKVPNGSLKWNLFDGLEGECGENCVVVCYLGRIRVFVCCGWSVRKRSRR